jgi:cAMP-binding proteins - catabolite gene activator and regulatory subunit of cAMP-dependent protein kinases
VALEPSQFRQAIIENTLRSCQLFMGLPAADIVAIASFIVSKHLDKGEYLFREGDRSEGFYVVQKGAINVHRVNAAGKEQVIHLFQPIESFAEATLATEGGYPRMRARRSHDCSACAKERFCRSPAKATRSRTAHARLDESASPRNRGIARRSHSERHGNPLGQLVAKTMPAASQRNAS